MASAVVFTLLLVLGCGLLDDAHAECSRAGHPVPPVHPGHRFHPVPPVPPFHPVPPVHPGHRFHPVPPVPPFHPVPPVHPGHRFHPVPPVHPGHRFHPVPPVPPFHPVPPVHPGHRFHPLPPFHPVPPVHPGHPFHPVPAHCRRCPSGWTRHGKRCFLFVQSQRDWMSSELTCLQLGGHLASFHSQGQYDFLRTLAHRATGHHPRTWVGANNAIKDGVWMWTDGSRFDYVSWGRGEPNNLGGHENCMEINHGGRDYTNDERCSRRNYFICAKHL